MNPDETLLLEWLKKNGLRTYFCCAILDDLKQGKPNAKFWLDQFRQWSREGIEGATSALNAAERIYGRKN